LALIAVVLCQEKALELIEVYKQFSIVNFDLEHCNRELIKEGKIIQIDARNGRRLDRYLYLVSVL